MLPAVTRLLELPGIQQQLPVTPRAVVTDAVRTVIEDARRAPQHAPANDDEWTAAILEQIAVKQLPSLRRLINATGVVLHTNLGRAPLAAAALRAIQDVASGFCNLEYDIATGGRGSRHSHCSALIAELTGAEDAMVVNNCAAALVLALNSCADGREAIISRGELVEIGGSFRVPDIMAKSGATLIEVGTTNRTHADDYRRALSPRTGAIVTVHRSNFTLEGFVAAVPPRDLAAIAAEGGVPLIHDFGSGLLLDLTPWGLTGEPTASDAIRAGASLVLMSGDKLLGGPQAGIVAGRAEWVGAMRRNPLARALRVDKMTLAALEATLALYRDPARAIADIPVLAMLTVPVAEIAARAERLAARLRVAGISASTRAVDATVGGGAFPAARIPSAAVALDVQDADSVAARLRGARVPVIGRIADGVLLLDLRSVPSELDTELGALVAGALS
jgi:L-seryl-tRNA(Ser) seleniumtransferase